MRGNRMHYGSCAALRTPTKAIQDTMKTNLKHVILCTAIGFSSLDGLSVLAQDKPQAAVAAQKSDSAMPPELMQSAEAMVLALNQKEVDKAFSVMTDKGADQYIASMLLQFSQISQMEDAGAPGDDLKDLKKTVEKYGLDKAAVEMPMPNGSGNAEKMAEGMVRAMEKSEKAVLECIPVGDRRKATLEMIDASAKVMMSPMSLALGKCEINGQQAELQVVAKLPPEMAAQGGGGMEEMTAAYLLFFKGEKGWRFDGFNNKRLIEEMLSQSPQMTEPFKEIKDLSLEGKTIDDKEVSLASYKGKVVLVDFWGTWCGPCVAGIPKLTELNEKYKSKGFEILGVAADDADSLKAFLEKKPMAWTSILDAESELAQKYSIEAYPTTLLVDKEGKHVATNLHGATLEKAVEMLLEGKSLLSITGSAQDILAAAKKQAAEEKKFIFLHFGAEWCGPCKILEGWMAQPEIHALFEKTLIDVKIDTDNNAGAQELLASFTANSGGIPWFAILNATDDKPISTCEGKDGNIGVPDSKEGIDHFTKVFEATGKFNKEQVDLIRSSITAVIEKFKSESPK